MPQFNLSEASGEELRRLFYESRHRGDMAVHDAVLRELRAREARPPEPRNFQPPPPRGEAEGPLPVPPSRPPEASFAPVDPYGRGAQGPGVEGPRPDGPSRFGPQGHAPLPGAPGASEPGRFTTLSVGREAPPRTPAAQPQVPAKLALFVGLALAVGALGGWLAHEAGSKRGATPTGPTAVATQPGAAVRSSDPLHDAGTPLRVAEADRAGRSSPSTGGAESLAAPSATAPRRGIVIIQSPPRTVGPKNAAPIRPRLSALQTAPPRPLPPAQPRPQQEPQRALAAAQPDGPVRVFIHVTDPAQRPAVDRIRSELGGLNVAVPPVRFVRNAPGRTELRCLKQADCAAAGRIARDLTQALRTPVTLVDMSRTYEHDGSVRPGSLELWVAPGV